MLPRWKLLGDPAGLVNGSSPPSTRTNRAENRTGKLAKIFQASHLFVSLLTMSGQALTGSLGSWLTVVIDVKEWASGWAARLGPTHAANPAHFLPILPVASHSDADGISPTSPRCKYRAFGGSVSPVAPFPLLAEATCQIPASAFPGKCPRAVASHRLKAEAREEGK